MVDFATHANPLIQAEIKVIAGSVDSVEQTAELKAGLHVGFPMYAELDAHAIAESTGAFIQTGDRTFLHSTGFLVRPDGKLATGVYATGPVGRLTPSDVLRIVAFLRKQ